MNHFKNSIARHKLDDVMFFKPISITLMLVLPALI